MKPIKVFWHGKRLRDIYPHATRWEVFKWKTMKFIRKIVLWSATIGLVMGSTYAGFMWAKVTVEPEKVIAKEIVEVPVDGPLPVLERIADCESGKRDHQGHGVKGTATQIDPTTHQVMIKTNTDGSVDVGYMQINSVNFKDAAKRGYDVTKEADNKAYGLYLFKTRGSQPWKSSITCWNI